MLKNVPLLILATSLGINASSTVNPTLPQVKIDTKYSPPSGSIIDVKAGGDLQAALNKAKPGDTLVLEAGATYTGHFVLPEKSVGSGWIYIRSSAYAKLPTPAKRVTVTDAVNMPKIVAPDTAPAITTADRAHHYRFVGIEITTTHTKRSSTLYNLVLLGDATQTQVRDLPNHITIDRCYIHGTPTGNIRRGVTLNGVSVAVVDSLITECHEEGADAQAIGAWSTPGPLKVVNCRLEGSGENFMLGGSDSPIQGLIPSDIEFRRNYLCKPMTWHEADPSYAGIDWVNKNIFELKNAQRVLVDGNVFENNWVDGQVGYAIVLTPRNQDGSNPWSVVRDVTFTRNIVRHSASAFNILSDDHPNQSQRTQRIKISDNLIYDIDGAKWSSPTGGWGSGHAFQVTGNLGCTDLIFDHNTILQSGSIIAADGGANKSTICRNNIVRHNEYGVFGSGVGIGNPALESFFPAIVFVGNILQGGPSHLYSRYPGNHFPSSVGEVDFMDASAGDYRLSPKSPFRRGGTDGKDIGADIKAVMTVTSGVVDGLATVPSSKTRD